MTNSSHTVVAAPVVLRTVYVDRWEKIAKIFTPAATSSQYAPLTAARYHNIHP